MLTRQGELGGKWYICRLITGKNPLHNSVMQFIVPNDVLSKQVQMLSGVLSTNNTLPILDFFLFELSPGKLVVSASDLETTISTEMEVQTEDSGVIAIMANLLANTLKGFGNASIPLTFVIDTEAMAIDMTSEYGKYRFPAANGAEFPKAPEVEAEKSFSIDGSILAGAIARTVFATGNDDLRPVMSGVFFEVHEGKVNFVATDAHRLVRYSREDVKPGTAGAFIVPKKPLNLIKLAAPQSATEVEVTYNDKNARFQMGDVQIISRLIDGKYPNYEAVIPKENPNKLTVNREQLLQSVRRVALFANKTTSQVRLKIAGSELIVSAEDLDFANSAVERMSCSYQGEDMEIGFNSRFIVDMLNNIGGNEVVIELSAPNRAGILLPAEREDEGEDMLMLVMPVMLNS